MSYRERTYCLSVRSMKACRSRSRCRSASDHCRRACSAARKAAFFLFKRMLIHRSIKETTSWTLRRTMMTTLPGMYCGASLLRKISDPQMFPMAKETRVIALMVDCSFVSTVFQPPLLHMYLLGVSSDVGRVVGIYGRESTSERPNQIHSCSPSARLLTSCHSYHSPNSRTPFWPELAMPTRTATIRFSAIL
jgi:hypothetical protein